jgi:arylsulfatase A-like enzyme
MTGYKTRYSVLFLLLFAGWTIWSGCAEDKKPEQKPKSQKSVDYSFYRFIMHLDEALEITEIPKDINTRIVTSLKTILKETPLKPVEEKLESQDVDFTSAGAVGAIQKFQIWVPTEGNPVNDGIASVKLHFKDNGKIAGLVFRYSKDSFYFCGLQSGPGSSLFLARYLDDVVTIMDYSELPVALAQDHILSIQYHRQFFEIIFDNQLFRIVNDAIEPLSGSVGYFSSDPANALAQDLETSNITSLDGQSGNLLKEMTTWEQLLFYRHNRINFDLLLKRRDHSIKAEFGGETRPSFFLFPEAKIRYRIKIPPSGRLDYGLGVPKELAHKRKITFRLAWAAQGEPERELARVDLGVEESGQWIDQSVDLSGLVDREGIISFEALLSEPGQGVPTGVVVSNPLMRTTTPTDKPNIIIYLVNSLRRDSLGVYGNQQGLSPNIDQWATQAAVFERAFAQAPWVKPSVASLFLSLYPQVHTILQFPDKILSRYVTLAEWLAASGYRATFFSENPLIGPGSGIDQGFDHSFSQLDFDRIRSFISREDQDSFFLFIHANEPHGPYKEDKIATPPISTDKIKFINDLKREYRVLSRRNYQKRSYDITYDNSDEQTEVLDKIRSHIEDYKKLYRVAITQMDRQFGQLLEILEQSGKKEDTLLVFLSANGQEFFEHDTVMNGDSLYQELIQVPFILSWPRKWEGERRIAQPVELVDFLPTFLDILNTSKQLGIQGTSFVPLLDGLTTIKDAYSCRINLGTFYKPYADRRGSYNVALIRWPHKIIYNQTPDTVEIYDLSQDPGEKNDLAEKQKEFSDKLTSDLKEWIKIQNSLRVTLGIKKDKMVTTRPLQQKLKALGYVD